MWQDHSAILAVEEPAIFPSWEEDASSGSGKENRMHSQTTLQSSTKLFLPSLCRQKRGMQDRVRKPART